MTQEELDELKEKVQKAKKASEVAEVNYRLLREEFEAANTAFVLSNASSFPYKIGDKIKYTRKYSGSSGYSHTEEATMIIDSLKARRTNSSGTEIDILCYPMDRPNYENISIAVDLNGNVLWDDTITIEKIKEE